METPTVFGKENTVMKKTVLAAASILGLVLFAGAEEASDTKAAPAEAKAEETESKASTMSEADKMAYALGNQIGTSLQRMDLKLDYARFNKALEDALAGKEPEMGLEEAGAAIKALQKHAAAKQRAKMLKEGQAEGADAKDAEIPEAPDMGDASCAVGAQIGSGLASTGMEIDSAVFSKAVADTLDGKDLALSPDELMASMGAFRELSMKKQAERAKKQSAENKAEEEAFFKENTGKEGVVSLPSGLQYTVLTEGTGEIPKSTDKVKVHYRGGFVDGTEFDSSFKRDKPAVFPVTRVVKGWIEALQLMKVGAKWKIFVPSALGYGERGSPPRIPPAKMLIFEIELLEIVPEAPEGAVVIPNTPAEK